MRSSGGCTIQQALTSEAATVVKQAVTLAKQRGHAQVTPLHVASAMLSGTLLKAACLQSHSHPLQGRALELCFGVALNRLPTSSSTTCSTSPMLMGINNSQFSTSSSSSHYHGQQQHPSISNALVAAFKRAQAHQRRGGSVENQQQPILVVKIDLQQLIISILDDPSVSRVMKEAGFSSTLVKDKVEQAHVSTSSSCSNINNNKDHADIINKDHGDNDSNKNKKPTTTNCKDTNNNSNHHQVDHRLGAASVESAAVGSGRILVQQEVAGRSRTLSDQVIIRKDDISSLIDSLMKMGRSKKRSKRIIASHVVVGECLTTLEGVVRGAMEQLDKKGLLLSSDDDDDDHHQGVKSVPIALHSFANLNRQQVEQQLLQLNYLVKTCLEEKKKVILYLGDLKWCIEFREANNNYSYKNYYCPIEHMVEELGRLVSSYCDSGRLWLIGIATFQTYIKCSTSGTEYPSLETIWGLQPIMIPAGSLALSLLPPADSRCNDIQSPSMNKKGGESSWLLADNIGVGEDKSETVARSQQPNRTSACKYNNESPTSSRLPSWLQQCKDDQTNRLNNVSSNQDPAIRVKEVRKRWNSFNGAAAVNHHEATTPSQSLDRTLCFSSISPPNSSPSYDHQHYPHPSFTLMQHRQEPNNFCLNNYHAAMPSSTNNTTTTSYDHQPSTAFTMSIHQHHQDDRYYDKVSRQKGFFISSSITTTPNNSTPNSTCSSDIVIMESSPSPRFKEYNVTNFDALCKALEEKVPWQKDIIPEIASTVLHCRSGTGRRRRSSSGINPNNNEETWLLFQGLDMDAKVKIAEELARLIFGSQGKFISIPLSSFSSSVLSSRVSGSDSMEDSYSSNSIRNKRLRDEQSCSSYIDRFAEAVSSDPHRVFFIEDVEQVDYCSQMGLKKAIERGKLFTNRNDHHQEVGLNDAIIILSCETGSFSSRSRGCSPTFKARHDDIWDQTSNSTAAAGLEKEEEENNTSPSFSLDLNISINDDDNEEEDRNTSTSFDNIGLVASVDRCVMFSKIHNL